MEKAFLKIMESSYGVEDEGANLKNREEEIKKKLEIYGLYFDENAPETKPTPAHKTTLLLFAIFAMGFACIFALQMTVYVKYIDPVISVLSR